MTSTCPGTIGRRLTNPTDSRDLRKTQLEGITNLPNLASPLPPPRSVAGGVAAEPGAGDDGAVGEGAPSDAIAAADTAGCPEARRDSKEKRRQLRLCGVGEVGKASNLRSFLLI
jgi:hypothetical protein